MKNNINSIALDNAAKIYPAAANKNWNAVFAITAVMKKKVNKNHLQVAVNELAQPFETLYMNLQKGFFWNKLKTASDFNVVEKDSGKLCRKFDFYKTEKPLFRIVYNGCKIRAEFSHCLTDGTGALTYLKSLILRYCEINENISIQCDGIKRMYEYETEEEKRDEFFSLYKKGLKMSRKDTDAYQLSIDGNKYSDVVANDIVMPLSQVKALSKSVYGCTVTQYVATVYALALLDMFKNDKTKKQNKNVKLSIPVNLRNMHSSQTLRNFASYVTIDVTPQKEYTFENVLKLVKKGMKEKITKENLFASVSQNIADEKMIISRYSPDAIKRLVMKNAFYMFGEKKYTSTVTSVGVVKLPKELEDRVEYISATLGATALNKVNCAVLGNKNNVVVTISTVSSNREVEKFFVDFVQSQGISTYESEKPASSNSSSKLTA